MKLRRLPHAGTWEVGVPQIPGFAIEGEDVAGVLFVIDVDEGLMRYGGPLLSGESPRKGLLRAAQRPGAPCRPRRPRTIRCRPHLAEALGQVAWQLGAKLEVTDDLPAIDSAARSFTQHTRSGPALPQNPDAWRKLLPRIMEAAPWRGLSDSLLFQFPGGGPVLGQAIAIVLGNAREQHGFVIYPSLDDYETFSQLLDSGDRDSLAGSPDWSCICVHLDPVGDLQGAHRRIHTELGLVCGGLYLDLFAVRARQARTLTGPEELASIAAIEGILGVWDTTGEALESRPAVSLVSTSLGDLTVMSMPASPVEELEPVLAPEPHQIFWKSVTLDGKAELSLVLKMGKRDAERLARRAQGVDALSLEVTAWKGMEILAWAGDDCDGVLTRFDETPLVGDLWERHRRALLIISAGGAKRKTLREQDIVCALPVELLLDEA